MRAALFLLCLAAPLAAKPVPLVELEADPIPLTRVQMKRGGVDVRVSLGFDKALLLNLAPAQQLGLKPFPLIGKFKVKNPQIPGGEAMIRGNFVSGDVGGTGMQKLPTIWIDKDVVVPPQQGIVSVLAFDADRVRIRNLRAPAGGQVYRLARAGKTDAEVKLNLGGETLRLIFDFTSERSVMNARAAAVLESEGMVRRTGRVGLWSPVPAFAVPVELLRPEPGAKLQGLPLFDPVVRISRARAEELDARAAAGITGDSEDDPDAIVVTAEREKGRRREPWILIGRDVLRFCGTVELDRPGAAWVLTCQFPG
ncbi:hypothetical protein FJQ54_00915 [Sandaracinobacter neustonicus]|uniref:Uncharacterized protein n=1 Tax=Sandaracinobacter neustonicus TaxID=1715348 RepID=A0A501XWW5_9SPHN|nr:hypothetical protein [Sandaracinobacter neustonicus]TPE64594.1 hypothetical protein FJQ54_00915 [Sandaracinobacter neustonicus]